MEFLKALEQRILTLDGAMGTELIAKGAKGALELCNVDNPAVVEALHEAYLDAGADIITTNTTCADALCLEQYGLKARSYELARAGAEIARRVADKYSTAERRRYVAGSVGPTSRNLTLANDIKREDVEAAYANVVRGLLDGGVDVILIETVTDSLNATIAIEQVRRQNAEIPIILSAVLARMEGRVASGATIAKFLEQIPLDEVSVVGFNCTNGVKPLESALRVLAATTKKPIIAYPSVGQPPMPMTRYVKDMDQLCRAAMLNIAGGCCGTTPAHIAGIAKAAARWRGRKFEK
ncbi:MAG: homocysteine S-methyltransferase family protein [Alistipes sp.]|nr:homocysteine S-methyltransferase family protein [Alistipes sp.]